MDSRINLLIAMSRLHDDLYEAASAQRARTYVALHDAAARPAPRRTRRRLLFRRVRQS